MVLVRPALTTQHEMPVPAVIVASPANTLFEDVGKCDLPVTTNNELARKLTHQGFALIHCFWYNEAVRSFRDAIKVDPQLGIAYAGLALSLSQPRYSRNEFKAEAGWASGRAVALARYGSEIEQSVIAAMRSSVEAGRDAKVWARSFQTVMDAHPEVHEPKVILAGMLIQLRPDDDSEPETDAPQVGWNRIIELCEQVIRKDARHAGALHYHIHACEGKQPARALESAKRLTRLATDSSHMVHMPGHIFYRVGDYEAANAAFYEADRKSVEYARGLGEKNAGRIVWDYGHNRSFWAASLVESGREKEMREKLPGLMYQTMSWLRAGDWQALTEASSKQKLSTFFGPITPYSAAWLSVEKEDWVAFDKSLEELNAGAKGGGISARIAKTMIAEVEGARLIKERKFEEGFAKMRESVAEYAKADYQEPPIFVRLPHESLGAALTARGETKEAIEVYEAALIERPNSVYVWIGLADAYREAGDKVKAKQFYDRVLKSDADRETGPVIRAQVAVAAMQTERR